MTYPWQGTPIYESLGSADVREMERERFQEEQAAMVRSPRPSEVLANVCDGLGTPIKKLRGPGKKKDIAFARTIAALALYQRCPGMTYTRIAELLGWAEHSVAIDAVKRGRRALAQYPGFRELVGEERR